MKNWSDPEHVNVGVGEDISIAELAALVARIVGFQGRIEKDISKPDGTPRKLVDVSRINALGWKARIPLEQGIAAVYEDYLQTLGNTDYNP